MITTRLILGFCCLLLLLPAYGADPDADDGKLISSTISEVTVYADRAQVLRVASVDLTGTLDRFAYAKLPGWIDEGSVRMAVVPAEAAQIVDVQIRRTFLARPSDEEFRKADQAVQEVSDQIAALDDEKTILEQQAKHLESMRMFSLEKLPKDVAVREIKPVEYGETVEFIAGAERKIATAKRELERKRRDLQPELSARQRKLEELRQRTQLEQRSVIVLCKGARAGKATLRLTYMLPGATWEPVHELRATTGAKAVSLASYAVVMQTTGEDWTGVQLALSTQKSTETLKIPELDVLLVGTGRRMARIMTSSAESFAAARQNYAGQNGLFNSIVNGDVLVQEEYRKTKSSRSIASKGSVSYLRTCNAEERPPISRAQARRPCGAMAALFGFQSARLNSRRCKRLSQRLRYR